MTDVPHAVWRAVESIPRQRGPYGTCRCQECAEQRAQQDNAEDVRTAREES